MPRQFQQFHYGAHKPQPNEQKYRLTNRNLMNLFFKLDISEIKQHINLHTLYRQSTGWAIDDLYTLDRVEKKFTCRMKDWGEPILFTFHSALAPVFRLRGRKKHMGTPEYNVVNVSNENTAESDVCDRNLSNKPSYMRIGWKMAELFLKSVKIERFGYSARSNFQNS